MKTSTIVLIALAGAALCLGVALIFLLPKDSVANFFSEESWNKRTEVCGIARSCGTSDNSVASDNGNATPRDYYKGRMFSHGFTRYADSRGISMIMILLVIGSIVGAVIFMRRKTHQHVTANGDTSMEILTRQFAEGKISREEFEHRKTVLKR